MKKYKDRYLRKIAKAINIAYLSTAIFCGYATFTLLGERDDLKQSFKENELSYEEFIDKSLVATEREEEVFKMIATGLGVVVASDVALKLGTKNKDL